MSSDKVMSLLRPTELVYWVEVVVDDDKMSRGFRSGQGGETLLLAARNIPKGPSFDTGQTWRLHTAMWGTKQCSSLVPTCAHSGQERPVRSLQSFRPSAYPCPLTTVMCPSVCCWDGLSLSQSNCICPQVLPEHPICQVLSSWRVQDTSRR